MASRCAWTPAGEGRIAIGGATLAKGYRNPPEPDPFAEPGWFHTDDLGVLDEAGRLAVLGRADEAISTGGLTVMPAPVEAVLSRHPAVADCAVFGVPDERLGERVVAAVVLVSGAVEPSLDDIRELLGALPGFDGGTAGTPHHRRTAPPGDRQAGPPGASAPLRKRWRLAGRLRLVNNCSLKEDSTWVT